MNTKIVSNAFAILVIGLSTLVVVGTAKSQTNEESNIGSADSPLYLSPGELDTRQFGWLWGTNARRAEVVVIFDKSDQDLSLSVSGYDIDLPHEVDVLLNGTFKGRLSQGKSNAYNGGDSFNFTVADQNPGTNEVRFVQVAPGWKWGIGNINLALLGTVTTTTTEVAEPSVQKADDEQEAIKAGLDSDKLTTGREKSISINDSQIDSNSYGWAWGSSVNREEVVIEFTGGLEDLNLRVTGYDIDFSDEVNVFLNGDYWGSLSQGESNDLNEEDVFRIQGADQIEGVNRIQFVQSTPGWKWGVTNISMQPLGTFTAEKSIIASQKNGPSEQDDSIAGEEIESPDVTTSASVLNVGIKNEDGFGWYWAGRQNRDEAVLKFTVAPGSYTLEVFGYDIDFPDEISVLLNDRFVGNLRRGGKDTLNEGDIFKFESDRIKVGENTIRFVQKSPGWKWGVTNILLLKEEETVTSSKPITINANVANTSQAIETKPKLIEEQSLVLKEVEPLAPLKGNENSSDVVVNDPVDPSKDVIIESGANQIAELETDVILQLGIKNTGQFGYYYGKKKYREEVRVAFQNIGADLNLTVSGYSIDDDREIQLVLNDVEVGHLVSGVEAEGLVTTSLKIPYSIQKSGYNLLVFRQRKPGWKWGITDLFVETLTN